jgi:hypothetical protein
MYKISKPFRDVSDSKNSAHSLDAGGISTLNPSRGLRGIVRKRDDVGNEKTFLVMAKNSLRPGAAQVTLRAALDPRRMDR